MKALTAKRTIGDFIGLILLLGVAYVSFCVPNEAHAQQTAYGNTQQTGYGVKHIINAQVEWGQGTISPSGEVEVEDGGRPTFTMVAADGWEITNVKVDMVTAIDRPYAAEVSYTFDKVTTDHTISVTFEKAYTISIDGEGQGTISYDSYGIAYPSGAIVRAYLGERLSFEIKAAEGWVIDAVYKDGVEMGYKGKEETSATAYFGNRITGIIGNHSLKAVFIPLFFKLTIKPAEEGGTTNPSPGEYTYRRGTYVGIHAIPSSGYRFKEWSGDTLVTEGNGDTYNKKMQNLFSFSIGHDRTIKPHFIKAYTITATASSGGTIYPTTAIVDPNDSQGFFIGAHRGYIIKEVLVDGVPVPDSLVSFRVDLGGWEYVFGEVIKDHHIHVNFALATYTIEPIAGRGGSISPGGKVKVQHGTDQKFIIKPDEGYEIESITVTRGSYALLRVEVDGNNSYTFRKVDSSYKIIAEFKPKLYTITTTIVPHNKNAGTINPSGSETEPIKWPYDERIKFAVFPNTGYEIWRVERDDYDVTDNVLRDGEFSFTVSGEHTVRAEFREAKTVAAGTALFSVANEGKGIIEADTGSGFEDVTNRRRQLADNVTRLPLRVTPQDDRIDNFIIKEIKLNGETAELTEDEKIYGFQGDVEVAEGLRVEVGFTCLGDSDGDGKIDVRDVILTARHAAEHKKPEGEPLLQGDALWRANVNSDFDENGQARINILDIILVVRRIVGMLDRFPAQIE